MNIILNKVFFNALLMLRIHLKLKKMRFIKWIKNKLQVHYFSKPIVSEYRSFNVRNIIFECRCGKRELRKEVRGFDEDFSMPTSHLVTTKQMNEILNLKRCKDNQ